MIAPCKRVSGKVGTDQPPDFIAENHNARLKESIFKITLKSPLPLQCTGGVVELNTAGSNWETMCQGYAHEGDCF